MNEPPHSTSLPDPATEDRLDSWKEIATYLRRDVTTVQRWERREGMPVHRHVHDKVGSVYAFRSELDAWSKSRSVGVTGPGLQQPPRDGEDTDVEADTVPASVPSRRRPLLWALGAAGLVLAIALTIWGLTRSNDAGPLEGATFQQLTDFGGAAALSRDGKLVAFLSDRDGQMDVWVGHIGTGRFENLTKGTAGELVNPGVRALAFSPDGSDVTYWTHRPGDPPPGNSTWAVPVLDGPARPYLEAFVEPDWSTDGTQLVYHASIDGDPMFVLNAGQEPRQIFSAEKGKGLHAHFQVVSPDQSFIYFVLGAFPQGVGPDRTDIWRIPPTGGTPEPITHHNTRVSHPVFLDARTLLYLASEPDGTGPFLYSLDVRRRTPKRESFGIERYTALAASADGSRVVATRSSRKGTLWRIRLRDTPVDSSAGERISLTTGNGFAPRFGPGFLLYVSSKGDSDVIWKLTGTNSTELWSAPGARVTGAPSIAADGGRITFVAERNGQTSLYVMNADGTNDRPLTSSVQLQGAPAWAPNGQSVTVGAVVDGTARLLSVPVDGSAPRTIVHEFALDPAWSTDGHLLAYSGTDIGTAFPLKMIAGGGTPYPLSGPPLRRGSRRLGFPSKRMLVVMRGEIAHKNLRQIDLETGKETQLTKFLPDFIMRDFDISPDGREIVVEQVQENSEIVLIERQRR